MKRGRTLPTFATDNQRWEAVKRRCQDADGAFYYSVKTTGVYCRPTCAARLPRRENVGFHTTRADAERAGFRPCKRCRPDQDAAAPTRDANAAIVAAAREDIKAVAATRSSPSEKAAPSHATADRIAALDWAAIAAELDAYGCAIIHSLLRREQCATLAALYPSDARFRSRVVMARHGFGRGEYKYFAYPLPGLIATLRAALYPPLATIANRWNEAMGTAVRYPRKHDEYLARCHKAGQTKPTPLLLQYGPGDYNCLHQDLYGEHVFPLQATVLLSKPGAEFTGGEFLLTEQRPRMQSRAEVVPLRQGEAVIFPVHHRPVQGTRGTYRVTMRHGVSRLRAGRRHTLGIIFHDAK